MARVRQNFPSTPAVDIQSVIGAEFAKIRSRVNPGARIAIGVGSRGIANLPVIVRAVLDNLKEAGAQPFILPAMGSHGGATPDGQSRLLETFGITEAAMGAPIRTSMEVRQIGASAEGVPAYCSVEALESDGVILVNRVKPHTDFCGAVGSGLLKMAVVGLGKRDGAAAMHAAAARVGHEPVIRGLARVILHTAPVLGGVAILENQTHETARVLVLPVEAIEAAEDQLLVEARNLMPRLPFDEIDLLIVDRIGKNISGVGLDPNVTGRWVQGYSSSLAREGRPGPFIRRIFVRDLTPETHGNAIGIGLADATTSRLVRAMDRAVTYLNSLTALTPQTSKLPLCFESDEEAISAMLASLAIPDPRAARVVHIGDTLSLADMEVSQPLLVEVRKQPALAEVDGAREMRFDPARNLIRG